MPPYIESLFKKKKVKIFNRIYRFLHCLSKTVESFKSSFKMSFLHAHGRLVWLNDRNIQFGRFSTVYLYKYIYRYKQRHQLTFNFQHKGVWVIQAWLPRLLDTLTGCQQVKSKTMVFKLQNDTKNSLSPGGCN